MTEVPILINAQLRSKQEEIQPTRCDVACIVELSNAEFYDFQFNPLADHDFIKEHLPDLKTDAFHAIPKVSMTASLSIRRDTTMPAIPHISQWHGSSFRTSRLKA